MSEADLRECLRAAVGDEPPLNFDPDELIQRARQARRRRRALVAVAVVTLALTGTVLSLPGVLDRRPGIDAATGPVLTTTASPSSQAPAARPVPTAELSPPAAPRNAMGLRTALSSHLSKRFTEVVPSAKVVSVEFAETSHKEPGHLIGWLNFVDGAGAGQVLVRLTAPPLGMTRDEFCDRMGCGGPVRQADGSYLASARSSGEGSGSRLLTHTVAHLRVDGSAVEVTGYSYDPSTGVAVRTEVALTQDQLVALATDPKLAAF